MNPKRQIVYRFYILPHVKQMEMVTKLKLTTEEDQFLKNEERQVQYFKRAEQKNILDQFWIEVEKQHGEKSIDNPFAKKS